MKQGRGKERFIFLRDFLFPNPRPGMDVGVSSGEGEQPLISIFGGIGTIFIMGPNEGVVNGIIEPEINIVNAVGHSLRKRSVQHKGPLDFSNNIFNREVEVRDVDDGDKRS
jgi:hypothetical protein